jgi:hypothetical protein
LQFKRLSSQKIYIAFDYTSVRTTYHQSIEKCEILKEKEHKKEGFGIRLFLKFTVRFFYSKFYSRKFIRFCIRCSIRFSHLKFTVRFFHSIYYSILYSIFYSICIIYSIFYSILYSIFIFFSRRKLKIHKLSYLFRNGKL